MLLRHLIIGILLSSPFSFFLTIGIYYFTLDNSTLSIWFYIFLLANAWDILSTYTFVYVYDLGWEEESNPLIRFFAKHVNYHWAITLQTLAICGPIVLFCFLWPWTGFSVFILIFLSVDFFIVGTLNFSFPFWKRY